MKMHNILHNISAAQKIKFIEIVYADSIMNRRQKPESISFA
jgi:hypothetical protein